MKEIVDEIGRLTRSLGRSVRLMEVCGTHTVAIFRQGIRDLLPKHITLLSGPGCPVCVTAVRDVDKAVALLQSDDVILTTFGDMMRVPGSRTSLFGAKAEGGDVRIVYSPLDALALAAKNRDKKVVFFATGFETTSPSVAGTLRQADAEDIRNFYIYSVHKVVPPALRALLGSGDVKVDGFILPGHVSTIIGTAPYEFIATEFGKPCVVTGFDATDILSGILMLLRQMVSAKAEVEIQYTRVVKPEGNRKAQAIIDEFFRTVDAEWRGIGTIPGSGLELRDRYRSRDIRSVLDPAIPDVREPKACSCGEILKGIKMPPDCPLFGKACTPERPVGACMVSTEGSCAAYYRYGAPVRPE